MAPASFLPRLRTSPARSDQLPHRKGGPEGPVGEVLEGLRVPFGKIGGQSRNPDASETEGLAAVLRHRRVHAQAIQEPVRLVHDAG